MKNTFAKFAVIAAVAAVPCFGTTLEAREMTGGEVAVRIVHDVLNFLNPAPVVVAPPPPVVVAPPPPVVVAPPPVYHRPAPPPPVYHRPAPPPRHHAPAPKHHDRHAPHHGRR